MEALIPILLKLDWIQIMIAILSFLFMLSEILGALPGVKSNSVYQLILSAFPKIIEFLKKLKGEKTQKSDEMLTEDEIDRKLE